MHHIALTWSNNDDKQNIGMSRRRTSSRPFSSTSGFIQSSMSDVHMAERGGNMSSAQSNGDDSSDHSQITGEKDGAIMGGDQSFAMSEKVQMQKKMKRL